MEFGASEAASLSKLQEQVRGIVESNREIKSILRSLDDRLRQSEKDTVGNHAITRGQIDAAHRRINGNDNKISDIDNRVGEIESKMPLIQDILDLRPKLIVMIFVSGFLGTTLGVLILGLLFNFLFGELL